MINTFEEVQVCWNNLWTLS